MKGIWVGILLFAVFAPIVRYGMWLPGRLAYRWLWKHMPEGRLKTILLKKRGDDEPTWPKLPPGA
ncbi:hypothetical protein [Stutzerimonas kunmingensis]|uniref:hypothetical protein n=1 Tax=Stutzerimonas kunmingensis TaxID=1211807 RepID=UPI002FC9AFB9